MSDIFVPTRVPAGPYHFPRYLHSCNPTPLTVNHSLTQFVLCYHPTMQQIGCPGPMLFNYSALPFITRDIQVPYNNNWQNINFVYMGLEQFEEYHLKGRGLSTHDELNICIGFTIQGDDTQGINIKRPKTSKFWLYISM